MILIFVDITIIRILLSLSTIHRPPSSPTSIPFSFSPPIVFLLYPPPSYRFPILFFFSLLSLFTLSFLSWSHFYSCTPGFDAIPLYFKGNDSISDVARGQSRPQCTTTPPALLLVPSLSYISFQTFVISSPLSPSRAHSVPIRLSAVTSNKSSWQ